MPATYVDMNMPPAPNAPVPGVQRRDLVNLGLIVLGIGLLVWLLPPQHEYAIIDDWAYADSVQHQLATGQFVMPGQSQANLIGQTLWGTLWSLALGFSVTTLTYSTLALALAGLLAFYGLLRRLAVPPAGALLGVALLALNPLWLHLSYSFMTDVPFLALTLIACYGYVRGLHSQASRMGALWLWGAGLVAGWAYLIRQFGVLVPAGVLAYLALDALLTRRIRWREGLHVIGAPALVALGWWLWTRDWPPTPSMLTADGWRAAFVMQPIWLSVVLLRALDLLPLLALSVCAALKIRRGRWWLIALWAGIVGAGMLWSTTITAPLIGQTEPPFVLQAGALALPLPQLPFTFGGDGNILRVDGIDFFEYHQQPIWTPEVWRGLFLLGTALGVLLLAQMSAALLDWWRARPAPDARRLVPAVYLVGLLIYGVTLALSGALFDRYLLGFLPFVILFVVRGTPGWGRLAWAYSLAALLLLATTSVLLKADAIDHTAARFQAGAWFATRGVTPGVGLDYNRGIWMGNAPWQVTDVPLPGFRTEATFTYVSRLSGWQTRTVLAQTRADLPLLPPPSPTP